MSATCLYPPYSQDDTSDSLSSNGTKNINLSSLEESSPYSEVHDISSLSNQTKKIRKKRCTYDKIDDEKRIRLLEAVQKGESLKSAAQRLQINYSSAKSILHTFRKEGRILKKSPFENSNRPSSMTNLPSTMSRLGNLARTGVSEGGSPDGPNSPMRGLTSIFDGLMIDDEDDQETGIMNILKQEIEKKEEDSVEVPELQVPAFMSDFSVNFSIGVPSLECEALKIPSFAEIANIETPLCQFLSYPNELLKQFDNFYMRYSNSPLSGGKGNLCIDCSDSGSRRYGGEFDSFTGMMNTFGVQIPEDNKPELGIPSFYRFSSNISAHGNTEIRLMKQASSDSNFVGIGEAFDSYMPGLDSQWLICDTLRKATFLNNLVHLQRSGSSVIAE